jgi:hypothetical protein
MKATAATRVVGAGLLAALALLAGCQAVYTSIEPAGENAYTVTSINEGFFHIYSNVYSCNASGNSMSCTRIDSQ